MSIDSKLLIQQIQARPAIWKRDDSHYFQKSVLSKLWAEISVLQGVDGRPMIYEADVFTEHERTKQVKLKNRWKALRDTFRQELKKSSQPTNWSFYNDMSFLKGHLKNRQTTKSGWEEDSPDAGAVKHGETKDLIFVEEFKEEPQEEREEDSVTDKINEPSLDVDMDEVTPCPNKSMENDDDYHFLMSFLPEMKRLHGRRKMLLRIKMMELFYKEIYQQNPSHTDTQGIGSWNMN